MRRSLTLLLACLFLAIGAQAKAATLSDWQLNLTSLGGPDIQHISDSVGGIGFNGNANVTQQTSGGPATVLIGDAFALNPISGSTINFTGVSYVDASHNTISPLLGTGQGTLQLVSPALTGQATTNGPNFSFNFANPGSLIYLVYTSPTNVVTQIASFDLIPSMSTGGIDITGVTSTSALLEGQDNISGLMTLLVPGVIEDSLGNPVTSPFYFGVSGAIGSGINLRATVDPTELVANFAAINGNFTISAVPEPASMLLMGSGVLGLFLLRRRGKAC